MRDENDARVGDVSWLFLRMTAAFGREWTDRYPPKKTRVVKNAKSEWARVISGFGRVELGEAIAVARQSGGLPPSTVEFWALLERRRIHAREMARIAEIKKPPSREVAMSSLAAARSVLGR